MSGEIGILPAPENGADTGPAQTPTPGFVDPETPGVLDPEKGALSKYELIKETFARYDINNTNTLAEEEFIASMVRQLSDSTNDIDQLKRQAKRIFLTLDQNQNGHIDVEEYYAGHEMLSSFLADPWARRAETATMVAQALPGGTIVTRVHQAALQVGATNRSLANSFSADNETASLLDKHGEPPETNLCCECCVLTTMTAYSVVVLLLFLFPAICMLLGWTSGQKCDQPLDTFCKSMFLEMVILLSLIIVGGSDQVQSKQKSKMPANPTLVILTDILYIGIFINFCFGCYWFGMTGNFLDPDPSISNCSKVAPDLWRYIDWFFCYVFSTLVFMSIFLCCMCCALCFKAGSRYGIH